MIRKSGNSKKVKNQKILWGVDPFEESAETRKHVLASLRELAQNGAVIQPIYIFSASDYGLAATEIEPLWLKKRTPEMKKALERYIQDIQKDGALGTLLKPLVLTEPRPSVTLAVRCLSNYARLHGADMIVVGTHARKGLARFFIGSFAETLLLHSKTPVLVVGPQAVSSQLEIPHKIFFPTDLGKLSTSLFKKILNLAKTQNSSVTLFHAIRRPAEPIVQSGVYLFSGAYLAWPDYVTESERRQRELAERFVQIGKKHGIQVSVLFDSEHGSISQSIVEHAEREKVHLIAMGAESGVIASAVMGSIARQVVRSAPCPVWVLRVSS